MLTQRQAHYPVEKAEPHRKVVGAHGPPAHRQHLQLLPSKAEAAIQGVPNAGTTHICTLFWLLLLQPQLQGATFSGAGAHTGGVFGLGF